MQIGVRELRNRTAEVIAAVEAGERITLTVHGRAVADIVPHVDRPRWIEGARLARELQLRAADPDLRKQLNDLDRQTLEDL